MLYLSQSWSSLFRRFSVGFKKNDLNLSYIYKVELGNELWFLPSVNVGFVSKNLNPSELIFEDQINSITGYINQESIDPLSEFFFSKNYTDLGASFLIHNTDFLIGINFDYLNKPNVAYDSDVFCLPSIYEPWGVVTHEMGALGLPILISNKCGSGKDLVQEGVNGFFFNPNSTQSIISAIKKFSLLTLDNKKKFSANSKRLAKKFSHESWSNTLLSLINSTK